MDELVLCVKCKRNLPPEAFAKSVLKHRVVVRCRACANANRRAKRMTFAITCVRCGEPKASRRSNQLYCSDACRVRAMTLRQYGLDADQDIVLFNKQKGLCAACAEPLGDNWSVLHVDHCHDTGRVRGLLHAQCNKTLADDSAKQFLRAVYLARHEFDLIDLCMGPG